MNVEQENLLQQEVFEWVSMPKGKSAGHLTRSRAVFEIKWDQMTGHMDKAKCRIVAQGFTQRYGVDFTETYATTPKLSTMRLFMKKALQLKMRRCEWDIKAAYLHSLLEESIFMKPPYGMEKLDAEGNPMVMKLKKSLYGLKQSGYNWMNDLAAFLKEYGMEQSLSDTSLWYLKDEAGQIDLLLFVHTDDGKLAYRNDEQKEHFMTALRAKFNVGAEKEDIDRIFNIRVKTLADGRIKLSQQKYIEELAKTYNVSPDLRVEAPMSTNYQVELKDSLSDTEIQRMRDRPFTSLLSALLWVARCTRPDICVALTMLSRASCKPDPTHWTALVKVLKYLMNTINRGLMFYPDDNNTLRSITDASLGNDKPTGRSISGQFVLHGKTLLDWHSRHQPYVTLHSGEAETVACASGCANLMYWIQLFEQMDGKRPVAHALTDSTTARNFLTTPLHTSQMKHIRIKLFFVRELVKAGYFLLLHIAGADNPSDLLTKPLSSFTIEHLLRTLVAWGGGLAAIDTQKAVLPSSGRPNSAPKRPTSALKRSSSDNGTGSTKRVRFT
ncbi:hypothetical protein RI054_14g69830 [Pseudoscourfieldia marina]